MFERHRIHSELTLHLATCADDELITLLNSMEGKPGWGMTGSVVIEGRSVFVKMIPVTGLEQASFGSTRNVFDLPTVYNYGVGSAGFGAAREVAAHIKTTQWVLDGVISNFALLHHHRVLPMQAKIRNRDAQQLDRYVASWDGNPAIRSFILARQQSTHCVALFIEHIPNVLQDWLPINQERVGWVIEQARQITAFLRENNVGHFDANPTNVLTDGNHLFFADFGLFLDADFELSDSERIFLSKHRYWDIAEFVASLSWTLPNQQNDRSVSYNQTLARYASVTEEMSAVFQRLQDGAKTSGAYDDEKVHSLLAACDLL